MIIYVANASLQNHMFFYRIKGQNKMIQLDIRSMSQTRLPNDFSDDDFKSLIEQKQEYGFYNAEHIGSLSLTKPVSGLCYSIGKPVSAFKIDALFRANHAVINDQGRQLRQEAAIASNNSLERTMTEKAQETQIPIDVKNLDIVIEEKEPHKGEYDRSGKALLNEGFRTDGQHTPAPPAPRRGKRKAA